MKLKFILITITFLLIQCSLGKPTPKEISKKSSEESNENETPSSNAVNNDSSSESKESSRALEEQLVSTARAELIKLAEFNVESVKELFKHVLEDLNAVEDKNDGILAQIEEIQRVGPKFEIDQNSAPIIKKLTLLMGLRDMQNDENEEKTPEDAIVEASLKKHGQDKMIKEFEEKFTITADKFYQAANEHFNSMNAEQQERAAKFRDWLQQYKNATTLEKKIELMSYIGE